MNIAAGLKFAVSPKVAVGAQAKLHNVFTEDDSTQYYGVGVLLSFIVGGPS